MMLPVLFATVGLGSVRAARVLIRRLVTEEVKSHEAFFCIRKRISAADAHVYPASKKQVEQCFPSRWCLLQMEMNRFLPSPGPPLLVLLTETQVLIVLFA